MSYIKIEVHQDVKTRLVYYGPGAKDVTLGPTDTWEMEWFKDQTFQDKHPLTHLPLVEVGEYKISLFLAGLKIQNSTVYIRGPHPDLLSQFRQSGEHVHKAVFSCTPLFLDEDSNFSVKVAREAIGSPASFSYRAAVVIYELVT